ncbi:hypothetical protein INT47_007322 [Mucor saturninus]|uniref:CSD domain-containing protein n=1 Tax=Mucor saturninus TaxID=64648 RepID=A0A8H7RAS1_9FUNG|nr:hypothetical protein INT47_007322 [Mucor saturninus]
MSTMETKTFPESRHKGHVKFFNSIKGYGFILPDTPQDGDGTEEVFVHHTAIQNSGGFKSLAEVEYDLVQGPKGMQASNVTGPDGSSVRGDPGTHRQQYTSSNNINNNNNGYHNNRGGPYNGGNRRLLEEIQLTHL